MVVINLSANRDLNMFVGWQMRPVDWKKFKEGTLNRGGTGNCLLINEINEMKLAPTSRAKCNRYPPMLI